MSETDRILAKCIPSGTSCDPQKPADDLRAQIDDMEWRLIMARRALWEIANITTSVSQAEDIAEQALTKTAPKK